jgi:hypothetical protein
MHLGKMDGRVSKWDFLFGKNSSLTGSLGVCSRGAYNGNIKNQKQVTIILKTPDWRLIF